MRAILISNGFQPDYEAGFANGLAANGVEVNLVASDRTLVDKLSPAITVRNLRGSQDEKRPGWRKALNLLHYFLRVFAFVARARQPVHMTGLFALSTVRHPLADRTWSLECRLLRLLSPRLLFTVHNVVPHGQDTPAARRELAKVYAIPRRLIVHTGRARQRLIDEFDIDPDRIKVMEHGIDELVPPDPLRNAATRQALGVPDGRKLVLFFGTVQPYKGVDLLLDAARDFPADIHLHIAGRCSDAAYEKQLRESIAAHPNRERITWVNAFLPEAEVSALLSATDVVAMPYRHIDQSGVLFAALRHGTPVVAFDVGSFGEYLSEDLGSVVPAGDVAGFAAAVRRTLEKNLSRERILQAAEGYLWHRTVAPILDEYRQDKP